MGGSIQERRRGAEARLAARQRPSKYRDAVPTTMLPRIFLIVISFAALTAAITTRPPKWLSDFDQSFYLTIAYDMNRHGIFSNGVFDTVDSTSEVPPSGMFFVPGYPLLVLGAMKIDARFARAVDCSVEANHQKRQGSDCEGYATPIHIIHAMLLTLGVLAIARCGEIVFASTRVFWIVGLLATGSLVFEADLFSFVMTESLTFSLYSIVMLLAALAWTRGHAAWWALTGLLLGLLCLTRPSFVILIPVLLVLLAVGGRILPVGHGQSTWRSAAAFAAALTLVVGSWIARNHLSVGKWGLTEEYGSAALVERFAYNDMSAREFLAAFPYCTPGLGELLFDQSHGRDSMHRFVYHTRDSFFHIGRGRRDSLVKEHGRLDPLIGAIVRDEMRENWWRHILVSIPLAWCGMWVGWIVALLTIPLFAWACARAVGQTRPLLLLYAAPAIVMLGLHAAVANHYTRYNLILIGPLAVGAAWIISDWIPRVRSRWQARAPRS